MSRDQSDFELSEDGEIILKELAEMKKPSDIKQRRLAKLLLEEHLFESPKQLKVNIPSDKQIKSSSPASFSPQLAYKLL